LGGSKIYVVDETVAGEKDADHVCSYLHEYLMNELPLAFKSVKIYLDAAPYFKNTFILWWAAEMICLGRFTRVIFVFMVPGHTKFGPDNDFARIANMFYITDVFNTGKLLELISACGLNPVKVRGEDIRQWKKYLSIKYKRSPKVTE